MTRPALHPAHWWPTLWPCTVIGLLVMLTSGLELILMAADLGLIGSSRWRSLVLQFGGFWPGLLYDWQPNYPWQPQIMFLSYSGLHAGFVHLVGNMMVLLWIGPHLVERLGQIRFALLWLASALGGALVFGFLTTSPTPMVGASGSIFGLMGAMVMFEYVYNRHYAKAIGITLGLALLNLVMLIWEGGLLAWQTHLGGYIIGVLAAVLLDHRRSPSNSD